MLTHPGKMRRIFWVFICATSYAMIVWMILDLYQQFNDPNNQKIDMTVSTVSRYERDFPSTYPQLVVCAKEPYRNYPIDIQKITIRDRDMGKSYKLSPLQPTFMEDIGNGYSLFSGFGLCSKIPKNVTRFRIHWKGFKDPLLLFFAVDPREPYIKQRMVG